MRLALITCERPTERDRDLDFLVPALKRRGVDVEVKAWTDPKADWASYRLVMLSSTWDYHERPEEFRSWLRSVNACAALQNPLELVLWNMDKRYLRELEESGLPVIPTVWIEPGAEASGIERVMDLGWDELIVKPVVDLGANRLVRIGTENLERMLAAYREPTMVQPFLPSLEEEGELSVVFAGGELLHAVRKVPATGDFRVQEQYGGTYEPVEPTAGQLRIATAAIAAAPLHGLYARVDLVRLEDGTDAIIELELIEPSLYLDTAPAGADTLARLLAASAA